MPTVLVFVLIRFCNKGGPQWTHQGETLTEPTVFPCCLSCENARFRIRAKCPHCPVCPTVVPALPMLCCSSKPRPDNFRCEETLKEFVAHRVVAPELSKEVGTHVEPSCKLTAEGGSCSSRAPTRWPWPVRFRLTFTKTISVSFQRRATFSS